MVIAVKNSTSLIEFKITCSNIRLNWLISRASTARLGNHMRIIFSNKFAKLPNHEHLTKLYRLMRVSYRWRCVCDDMSVGDYNVIKKCDNTILVNRYSMLQHVSSTKFDKALVRVSPACEVAQRNNNVSTGKVVPLK